MGKEFIKFPSINQFNVAIKEINMRAAYSGNDELGNPIYKSICIKPKIKYVGTPKLHGTNASVIFTDGEVITQSRNRIITEQDDNAGFSKFIFQEIGLDYFNSLFKAISHHLKVEAGTTIGLYGEWCGKGIQSGVAISQLEKMFVIFSILLRKDDVDYWILPKALESIPSFNQSKIKNIFDFPHYKIEIDFDVPKLIQNDLILLTNQVEKECPVGNALGVKGVGEGIVWRPESIEYNDSRFWFKVKGEEHSVSKVKTLASVDVEKVNSALEFIDLVVTEQRLNQGLDYLKEMNIEISMKGIANFIRWMQADIVKEETLTMEEAGLEQKDIAKRIADKSRTWFLSKINEG